MKFLPYLFVVLLFCFSCSKDADPNIEANILDIKLASSNVSGLEIESTVIDLENNIVYIMPNTNTPTDLDSLIITPDISISAGASIMPAGNDNMVFKNADDLLIYTVTAQNGNKQEWQIRYVGNQLPNADFETWHEKTGMDGKTFKEPGSGEKTDIWASANFGTSTYGVYGTTRFSEGSSILVKLSTGKTSTVPITSATIFTGVFDINGAIDNPTDPKQATIMGTPFVLRPDSMRILYRYKAGDSLIQATPKIADNIFGGFNITKLQGHDAFTIYAILEKRVDDMVIKVGRAEFSSSVYKSRLVELKIPFIYYTDDKPTHISFVAASSKDGDKFIGAVGSTLFIDNLKFIYN